MLGTVIGKTVTIESNSTMYGRSNSHRLGSRSYVDTNGHLTRDGTTSKIYWSRVILIASVLTTLVVTNPSNISYLRDITSENPLLSSRQNQKLSQSKYLIPKRMTNYGIFSVEEKIGTLRIHGLNTYWTCPNDASSDFTPLCDMIGKKACYTLGKETE